MGIPSYFNHIIKNHKKIFKKIKDFNKIHNLYLDSNSIIYDAMRNIDTSVISQDTEFEEELMKAICVKITEYINMVRPDNVFIAFDGVAPVAKLEQQRQRRYKSQYIKKIENGIRGIKDKNFNWDQTAITPGTRFMKELDAYVKHYFKQPMKFKCKDIIVSGSNEHGEGEHKIFDYIRLHPEYHKNSETLVYGLDADLIMLCLNHLHISKHINLFREKPDFNTELDTLYDENEVCILLIEPLGKTIIREMSNTTDTININYNKIFDYILISFLLGNDFLPHFPALNIRTNGITTIIETYKHVFKPNETIYEKGNISWRKFGIFIKELSKNEHENIKHEYKIFNKQTTIRSRKKDEIEKKIERFNFIPCYNRDIENMIDPYEKGWELRYYKLLFNVNNRNEYIKRICTNYLEGIEWTMKYYTTGCIHYRWKYNYHYPPLLVDLVKYVPHFDTDLVENNMNVINIDTQLAYVLPYTSLHLMSSKIKNKLIHNMKEYYSSSPTFMWAFCKYFWESHVNIQHIEIETLEKIINNPSK